MKTRLTITAQDQRGGRALHATLGDGVGHHAGVVANIRGLHFGDVQVPRLLRDEAAGVLLHEGRVLVKDPGEDQIWRGGGAGEIKGHQEQQVMVFIRQEVKS